MTRIEVDVLLTAPNNDSLVVTTNRRLVLGLVRQRGRPLDVIVQEADTTTRVPLQHLGAFLDGLVRDAPDRDSNSSGDDTATRGSEESLRSVDDPSRSLFDMDDTISLRLVIELVNDASGNARVNLHRFDRSIDYGPVSVHDLPAIIQALAPAHDPTRATVVDLSDDATT